ncbi:MAG: AbrB/MazE/SpoVT family DNA-binding domain-containing protein [Verrucomicrobiales bacterium]
MKTTVTERGQTSIPARLRREMGLEPGRSLLWEKVSQTECRLIVQPRQTIKPDPIGAIGFAQRHGLPVMGTDQWMKVLREGDEE